VSLNIPSGSSSATLDDRLQLDERYRQERDKRLNAQGTHQYVPIEGRFSDFAADPNAGTAVDRQPIWSMSSSSVAVLRDC